MEIIYDLIKKVAIYAIFMTIVESVTVEMYKKYIRLVCGFMIIFILITSAKKIMDKGEYFINNIGCELIETLERE